MFGVNVKDIIKGHMNEFTNRESELSEKRIKICKECPLYTNTAFGPICNSKKCYNPKTGELRSYPGDGFICGCQCRLKAKTTLINAKCILNKW